MARKFKAWRQVDKPTFKYAISSAFVATIVSLAIPGVFERALGDFEQEFGPFGRCIVGLFFGSILFAVLQFAHFWQLSRSIKRTVVHYLKVVLSVSPLAIIVPALLVSFFGTLILLCSQLGILQDKNQRAVYLIFFYTAVPLGLIGWFVVGTWYRNWVIERSKNIVESLIDNRSGLYCFITWDDKDNRIRRVLPTLEHCHFIFAWGITFSKVIGHKNEKAINLISDLLKRNPESHFYVLLQCPFCEEVIERAIGLNISYDENYIKDSVESISNCLAFKSSRIHVSLAHGSPYIRAVLWGRFKENSPFDALHSANKRLNPKKFNDPCNRSVSFVEWGGFLIQQCPPCEDASLAPLYQGCTITHGGMWDRIRVKFAQQFKAGVKPGSDLSEASQKTLEHLARDLGMSKRRVNNNTTDTKDLCDFIEGSYQYTSFMRSIDEGTNEKAKALKERKKKKKKKIPKKKKKKIPKKKSTKS